MDDLMQTQPEAANSGDGSVTTEVVETPAPGEADTPAETGSQETDEQKNARVAQEAAQKAAARETKRQQSINQRFAELTAEKKAAQELANQAIQLLQQGRRPPAPTGDGTPTRDQFDSYEDFVLAKATHQAEARARAMLNEHAQRQRQERTVETQQRAEREAAQAYARRFTEAASKIPDFAEVMADADVQVPVHVGNAIQRLDNGPEVAYHLQKNPALMAQLEGQSPLDQLVALGRISASLKTPANVSNAPPPGKTTGQASAAASASEPPDDPAAYRKWAEKHMKG